MEMYTTDRNPLVDRPIAKAWLVTETTRDGGLDGVLSTLKEKAAEKGADSIIGLRIAATEVGGTEISGKWYRGTTAWTAYGTAVRHAMGRS
jgi:uncharacterized protein YbjQ (UPF0145 family)